MAMNLLKALVLLMCVGESCSKGTIFGGERTEKAEALWQGTLRNNSNYKCPVSLIARNMAITARHCIVNEGLTVKFGSVDGSDCRDKKSEKNCNTSNISRVYNVLIKEGYDITVMELTNEIATTPIRVETSKLPLQENYILKLFAYWTDAEHTKRNLMYIKPNHSKHCVIDSDYKAVSMVLASEKRNYSQKGDSGGPLVMITENDEAQIGLLHGSCGKDRNYHYSSFQQFDEKVILEIEKLKYCINHKKDKECILFFNEF